MPRIQPVNPDTATGKAKALLDGVQEKFGMTPNLMRTMAQSPAVLEAYVAFSTALAGGALSAKLCEQLALAVSEANACDYCLAGHSTIGKMVGLSAEAIADSRRACACDGRTAAALTFARRIVDTQGLVSDDDVARVHAAGYSDGDVAEIIANVALTILTNYFNHVAETVVDFPAAPALASV